MARELYTNIAARQQAGVLNVLANIEVRVVAAGTNTLQTIYQDRSSGSQGPLPISGASGNNPFQTGTSGLIAFWAEEGEYDVRLHDTTIPARISDQIYGFRSGVGADNTVPGAKLADASLTGAKLANATVPDSKISALDAAKLTGTLAPARVADASLPGAKLASSAVGTSQIADDALTLAKAAPGQFGAMLGHARLADWLVGTNQVSPDLGGATVTSHGGTLYGVVFMAGAMAGSPVNGVGGVAVYCRIDAGSDANLYNGNLSCPADHTIIGVWQAVVSAGTHTFHVRTGLANNAAAWASTAGGYMLVFETSV